MSFEYLSAVTPRLVRLEYVSPPACRHFYQPSWPEDYVDTGHVIDSHLPAILLEKPARPAWKPTTPPYREAEWPPYRDAVGYEVAWEENAVRYILSSYYQETTYRLTDQQIAEWVGLGHSEDEPMPIVYRAYTRNGLSDWSDIIV